MSKSKRRGRGEGGLFFSEAKQVWIARPIVGTSQAGRPVHSEVTGRTKGEAMRKARAAVEKAKSDRPAILTLGDYLRHWLDNVAQPAVQPGTWVNYEGCVRLHILPHLRGHTLAGLQPLHVEAFYAALGRGGVSTGHIRKVSEVLSAALAHAARVGLIPTSPAVLAIVPRHERQEIRPFTPAEVRSIFTTIRGDRLEALYILAFGSGMRLGEMLGFGWEHLDWSARTLRVERSLACVNSRLFLKQPKSKRSRRVLDLPVFALEALRAHHARMEAAGLLGCEVAFCDDVGGFWPRGSLATARWRPILKRAGVPHRKLHTARHTHISELLSRGVPITDVARRVGDTPETILKVYAHWIPGNNASVVAHIEALYG